MVEQRVVDRQVLDETQKQLSASRAMRDAALKAVDARHAARLSALADVESAKAQVKVAEADERRTAALLAYSKVTAPYDGVITVRNANTGDYVQAASGDKLSSRASPMFVIARDDLLRIFVDVPEAYARYVRAGTKAAVRADALSGLDIEAPVTRTSWSVKENTRALWVEIDLATKDIQPLTSRDITARNADRPTKGIGLPTTSIDPRAKITSSTAKGAYLQATYAGPPARHVDPAVTGIDRPPKYIDTPVPCVDGLRPGMYVNTTVLIERPGVSMLPQAALLVLGNETYCYLLKDGTAVKTEVVPGLKDGPWIEVTKMKIDDRWVKINGSEDVVLGSLDELTDGQKVEVDRAASL